MSSELGETFRAMREDSQRRRAANLEHGLFTLRARGHAYTMFSGTHVRVGDYDYWPSTGLWIHVTNRRSRGRGILGLLCKLEPSKPRAAQGRS
jgi:hypothetical protein